MHNASSLSTNASSSSTRELRLGMSNFFSSSYTSNVRPTFPGWSDTDVVNASTHPSSMAASWIWTRSREMRFARASDSSSMD